MSLTKPSKMEKENYTNNVLHQLVGQYSSDSEDEKVGEKRTGIMYYLNSNSNSNSNNNNI